MLEGLRAAGLTHPTAAGLGGWGGRKPPFPFSDYNFPPSGRSASRQLGWSSVRHKGRGIMGTFQALPLVGLGTLSRQRTFGVPYITLPRPQRRGKPLILGCFDSYPNSTTACLKIMGTWGHPLGTEEGKLKEAGDQRRNRSLRRGSAGLLL